MGQGRYVLDENGDPRAEDDLMVWAASFKKCDRTVARDTAGGSTVSTVFLGLDHSFGSGHPLLYETMVFGGKRDGEQTRYGTKAEAVAGHAAIVARLNDEG